MTTRRVEITRAEFKSLWKIEPEPAAIGVRMYGLISNCCVDYVFVEDEAEPGQKLDVAELERMMGLSSDCTDRRTEERRG